MTTRSRLEWIAGMAMTTSVTGLALALLGARQETPVPSYDANGNLLRLEA